MLFLNVLIACGRHILCNVVEKRLILTIFFFFFLVRYVSISFTKLILLSYRFGDNSLRRVFTDFSDSGEGRLRLWRHMLRYTYAGEFKPSGLCREHEFFKNKARQAFEHIQLDNTNINWTQYKLMNYSVGNGSISGIGSCGLTTRSTNP